MIDDPTRELMAVSEKLFSVYIDEFFSNLFYIQYKACGKLPPFFNLFWVIKKVIKILKPVFCPKTKVPKARINTAFFDTK